MIKTLIKAYIKTRLNAIDKEIEELADKMVEEENHNETKSIIAQSAFEYSNETKTRLRKLTRRITIYQIIFGGIQ